MRAAEGTGAARFGQARGAFLSGDHAVAHAVRLARVRLVPVYPITPQTPILEKLSEMAAAGELAADVMPVESEHSAMAACIAAAMAGVRVFTATASQGLAYMHELLHYASGCRVPVVMVDVNRSLAAPWGFWADHTDSLAQRDTGWVQLYCESPQEALDTVVQAYRVAEAVRIPVMVVFEAVYVSHTFEEVRVPPQDLVDAYLPPLDASEYRMDVADPRAYGNTATPAQIWAHRRRLADDMARVPALAAEADRAWQSLTGRGYGLVEPYRMEGAEVALVALGGVAGTAREAVDRLRAEGVAAGLVRLRMFRPFPRRDLVRLLAGVPRVVVVDRDFSPGLGGIVFQEVRAALYRPQGGPHVHGFLAGVAGTNVAVDDLSAMALRVMAGDGPGEESVWYEPAGRPADG